MTHTEIVFFVIRLVLGGICAFLAILLWSKTRESHLMCLIAGALTSYAGLVTELLLKTGIIASPLKIEGIPVIELLFSALPAVFFILAFILMLRKLK